MKCFFKETCANDPGFCNDFSGMPGCFVAKREATGSAAKLAGLTDEEYKEITILREMTIKDAGIRGLQRFIELGNKVIDALISEQDGQ